MAWLLVGAGKGSVVGKGGKAMRPAVVQLFTLDGNSYSWWLIGACSTRSGSLGGVSGGRRDDRGHVGTMVAGSAGS